MYFHDCMFTILFSILLLLSMIQSKHAWPILSSKETTTLQKQFHSDFDNNDIVIIIPKPKKFHTVSCFQDIEYDDETEEDKEEDSTVFFFNEDDEAYYNDYEEDSQQNNDYNGLSNFFTALKDAFNSLLEPKSNNNNWSSSTWNELEDVEEDMRL